MKTKKERLEYLYNHSEFMFAKADSELTDTAILFRLEHHGSKLEIKLTVYDKNSWYKFFPPDGGYPESYRTVDKLCYRLDNVIRSFKKRIDNQMVLVKNIENVRKWIGNLTDHDIVVRKPDEIVWGLPECTIAYPADMVQLNVARRLDGKCVAYLKIEDIFGENAEAKMKIILEAMSGLEIIERI